MKGKASSGGQQSTDTEGHMHKAPQHTAQVGQDAPLVTSTIPVLPFVAPTHPHRLNQHKRAATATLPPSLPLCPAFCCCPAFSPCLGARWAGASTPGPPPT